MGCFSWLDCITKEQILIDEIRDVFVLVPNEFGGGHIVEHDYKGYGEFGCEDIYALVARWNVPDRCTGDDEDDREIGIDIACYDEDNARLKYPIKITYDGDAIYEQCEISLGDPYQGILFIESPISTFNVEIWHTADYEDWAKVNVDKASGHVLDIQTGDWDWNGEMTYEEAREMCAEYGGYTEFDPTWDWFASYEEWDEYVSG